MARRYSSERRSPSLSVHRIMVGDRRISVRLDPVTWEALRDVAAWQGRSLPELVTQIDRDRGDYSLTVAIRIHVVEFYRSAAIRLVRYMERQNRPPE